MREIKFRAKEIDFEGGYYWWKSDEAIFCEDDEITHWMPIPKLQEE